jgi:ankyrin repeat protein
MRRHLLLDNYAEIEESLRLGETPDLDLLTKSLSHPIRYLKKFLEYFPVDYPDDDGRTLLMKSPSIEVMQVLLGAGAEVNLQSKHGMTALHLLSYGDIPEAARLLLDNGADIEVEDFMGRKPIVYCVLTQKWNYAKALVEFSTGGVSVEDWIKAGLEYQKEM